MVAEKSLARRYRKEEAAAHRVSGIRLPAARRPSEHRQVADTTFAKLLQILELHVREIENG